MPYTDPNEQKKYSQDYYQRNKDPARSRNSKLLRNYGIDLQEYEQMLIDQDFCCKICGREESTKIWGRLSQLSVDHCHRTGRVRALLCRRCNLALGLVEDDWMLLGRMGDYLYEHSDDS